MSLLVYATEEHEHFAHPAENTITLDLKDKKLIRWSVMSADIPRTHRKSSTIVASLPTISLELNL